VTGDRAPDAYAPPGPARLTALRRMGRDWRALQTRIDDVTRLLNGRR
jgi:hypothetical protein